jgi:hypothetical protein
MQDALERMALRPPPGGPDAIVLDLARIIARILAREHDAAEQAGAKAAELAPAEG